MAENVDRMGMQTEHSRPMRADGRRSVDAILRAAMTVFAALGVDAPMRTIASEAGVGIGTLYRHFPLRSDLITAVVQREIDDCVEAAAIVRRTQPPDEALASWAQRLVDLVGTKRGLGPALHSGDPAYEALPGYFMQRLEPTLRSLLDAAATNGAIRADVDAREVLMAVMRLATPASDGNVAEARRMVALLVDGLRFGADRPTSNTRS